MIELLISPTAQPIDEPMLWLIETELQRLGVGILVGYPLPLEPDHAARLLVRALGGPGSGRYPKGSGQNPQSGYYHGTSIANAEKIKKEGLKPDHLLWVASDERTAISYGWQKSGFGKKFAVIVVKKTPETVDIFNDRSDGGQAFATHKAIGPDLISEIRVYSHDQFGKTPILSKSTRGAYEIPKPLRTLEGAFYVVVLLDDESEEDTDV